MAPAAYITPDWFEPGQVLISVSSHDPSVETIAAADLLVTVPRAHVAIAPGPALADLVMIADAACAARAAAGW